MKRAGHSMKPDASLPPDPYDLARFVDAQRDVYVSALAELRDGRKRGHWMWFIFPQFRGLGLSATSRLYAIHNLNEARAYLHHPVLGPRLVECAEAILPLAGRSSVRDIFGYPDDVKLKSSMTLFERAAPEEAIFARVLDAFFDGARDGKTIELIAKQGGS
jgi:uncharacterized protein (DUF1810 family)